MGILVGVGNFVPRQAPTASGFENECNVGRRSTSLLALTLYLAGKYESTESILEDLESQTFL